MTSWILLTIFCCLSGQILANPTSQVQIPVKSIDAELKHTAHEHTSITHISNEQIASISLRHEGHLLSTLDKEQTNSLTVEHEQRQTTILPTRDNPADIKPTERHLAFVKPHQKVPLVSTMEPALFEKILGHKTAHPVPKESKVTVSTKFSVRDEIPSITDSTRFDDKDEIPSTGGEPEIPDIPKRVHTYSITLDSVFSNAGVEAPYNKRLASLEANNHQADVVDESDGQYTSFREEEFDLDNTDDDPFAARISDSSPFVLGKDLHECKPCNCTQTDVGMFANCSRCSLGTVPETLPSTITGLNLDNNSLEKLNLTEIFALLPELKYLSVQSNQINRIILNCSDSTEFPLKALHLQDNKISIPDNCPFHHMPNLYGLYLTKNNISSLNNNTFSGLNSLRILDLSFNNLRHIQDGTFDSCSNISHLYLASNPYLSYHRSSMRPLAFQKLKRLKTLEIQGSSYDSTSYPDEALSYMTNLETLVIDGLKLANPPNLTSLKNLTSLYIGLRGNHHGKCKMTKLTSDFFRNLPFLTEVSISSCLFSSIDPSAFASLKYVQSITLEYLSNLHIESAFESLSQISADSPLEKITFKHIIGPNRIPCRYLTMKSARYIQHLRFKSLELSVNDLAMIEEQFFSTLPKSLEILNLDGNKFDVTTFSFKTIASLINLKTLRISKQNIPYFGDHTLSSDLEAQCSSSSQPSQSDQASIPEHPEAPAISNRSQLITSNSTSKQIVPFEDDDEKYANLEKRFFIPPNLTRIYASRFTFFGEILLLAGKPYHDEKLRILDFSHSLSTDWGKGSLPSHVQEVLLEGNYCDKIHTKFFPSNNSLERLFLKHNFLGPQFAYDENGKIFKNMKKMYYLDISNNLIFHLPYRFFEGFNNLQKLIIADNKIQNFNVTLAHLTSLTFINLQKNSISWISRNTRNDLDSIASLHPVKMDLTLNPLPCTCEGIELLHWMQTSNVRMLSKDFLYCVNERGEPQRIGNIEDRVQELRQRCFPLMYVIIIAVSFFLVFVICVSSVVLHRHRWRLIYIKNVLFVRWFGYTPSIAAGQTRRKFDAFIIYAEEDRDFVLHDCLEELERRRGHKLCVADRDFLPGSYITSNIICAVRNSTFTVPVLTPDFLHGQYCEYSTQMATYEAIFEKRPTLQVLLKSPVQHEGLNHDLLVALKSNKYVEMPQGPDGECVELWQDFWDRLSRVIGHGDHDTTERPALDLLES